MQLPDNISQRIALADIYFAKYKEANGNRSYDVISVHDIRTGIRDFHDEINTLTEELKDEMDESEISSNQELLDTYQRDLPKMEAFAAFIGDLEKGWLVFKVPTGVDIIEEPWWLDGIPVKCFSGEYDEPDANEYAFFLCMLEHIEGHITIISQQ